MILSRIVFYHPVPERLDNLHPRGYDGGRYPLKSTAAAGMPRRNRGRMTQHNTLMTEGNIRRKMLGFALPILAGYFFQQLYNTVDAREFYS